MDRSEPIHGSLHCLSCVDGTRSFKEVCCRWCRVLGSVAFRNDLPACFSTVVIIPYNPDSSTAKSMAHAIKTLKTGLPLDSFRS